MDLVAGNRQIPHAKNLAAVFMIRHTLQYILDHRWQLAKFIFVGVLTFGINFLMFHLFYGVAQLDYRISVSIAYMITVICHFSLHRFFTFNAGEQTLAHNAGKYVAMLGLNYAITLSMAWFVVEALKVSPYWGVIASTLATAGTSFFVMKYFVFDKRGTS
jgi:putative flippase GtrA